MNNYKHGSEAPESASAPALPFTNMGSISAIARGFGWDRETTRDLEQVGRIAEWRHRAVRPEMLKWLQDHAEIVRLPRWIHDRRLWAKYRVPVYGFCAYCEDYDGDDRPSDKRPDRATNVPSPEDDVVAQVYVQQAIRRAHLSPRQAACLQRFVMGHALSEGERGNMKWARRKIRAVFERMEAEERRCLGAGNGSE